MKLTFLVSFEWILLEEPLYIKHTNRVYRIYIYNAKFLLKSIIPVYLSKGFSSHTGFYLKSKIDSYSLNFSISFVTIDTDLYFLFFDLFVHALSACLSTGILVVVFQPRNYFYSINIILFNANFFILILLT